MITRGALTSDAKPQTTVKKPVVVEKDKSLIETGTDYAGDIWDSISTSKMKTFNPSKGVVEETEVPSWWKAGKSLSQGLRDYGLNLLKSGGDQYQAFGAAMERVTGSLDEEEFAEKKFKERGEATKKLLESGKYTPESIRKFANTGDESLLEFYVKPEKDESKVAKGVTKGGAVYDPSNPKADEFGFIYPKFTGEEKKAGGKSGGGGGGYTTTINYGGEELSPGFHKTPSGYVKVAVTASGKLSATPIGEDDYLKGTSSNEYVEGQTLDDVPDGVLKTEGQRRSTSFLTRMNLAEEMLGELEASGYEPQRITGYAEAVFPNWLKDEDRQKMEAAKREFGNAVLRTDTGAAYGLLEQKDIDKLFPQPGDKAPVIAEKRRQREAVMDAMAINTGATKYARGSINARKARVNTLKEAAKAKAQEKKKADATASQEAGYDKVVTYQGQRYGLKPGTTGKNKSDYVPLD